MTWQKHIIKKQVIELQVAEGLNGRDIQHRVSKIFRDSIIQQIDTCFNTGSPPGTMAKIDRLELDLGRIHISQLEEKLVEKIEQELQRNISIIQKSKVPAQTKRNGRDHRKSGSGLDTIAYFLQTGLLPWWAKMNTRFVFEEALEESLTHEPFQLTKLLNELLQDDSVLSRFIYSCSDKLLYAVIGSYMTGATAEIKKQEARMAILIEGARDAALLKQLWWQNIFRTVINGRVTSPTWLAENAAAVLNKSESSGSRLHINTEQVKVLIEEIQAYITAIVADQEWVTIILTSGGLKGGDLIPKTEFSDSPLRINLELDRKIIKEIKAYLIKVTNVNQGEADQPDHKNISSHFQALQNMIKANKEGVFTTTQKQQIQARCNSIAGEVNILLTKTTDEKAIAQIAKLQGALQHVITVMEATNLVLPSKQTEKISGADLPLHKKQNGPSKKLYDPFTETEKIYIQNAGLVLLWSFLHRFFQNIGLANKKAFVDEIGAEKACLMLQHLTGTAPEELFEAQLPLNKILCGLDLEQPVNTQWKPEPEEAEASEHFLLAVIQNGPLWKTLSIPAFRQAYLNREGALSTRDGNWLLQVKRETYDVIVDRLPWTIQVVKLPWMENLIFVEW